MTTTVADLIDYLSRIPSTTHIDVLSARGTDVCWESLDLRDGRSDNIMYSVADNCLRLGNS